MSGAGVIALHGGGEFLPGDEAFLVALLELVPVDVSRVRIAVVPTAAARGRPDLAAANGVAAFERVAAAMAGGRAVVAEAVRVVDEASAADPVLAEQLAAADVIHLPGGDPDLIPRLYRGTAAWEAIRSAHERGVVLAGASAGAMALASVTWTPDGFVAGLGLVPGCLVVPHADAASWDRVVTRWSVFRPPGVAIVGIAERTGVLVSPDGPWRVVGEGEVRWVGPGASTPVIARHGDLLER
jgi:cyanophycinase-like exopeptidase